VLLELVIENYAVVDRLRVRFHPGLNLLTGETGSGKSIVVDALGLLFGGRASADMIRSGHDKARISGIFTAPDPASLDLGDLDVAAEDEELLVEREILAGGKSRAFVGSRPAAVSLLREIAPALGDIHGQHEQQLLFSAAAQLRMVDQAFNGDAAVGGLFHRWTAAGKELAELERGEQEKLRLLDLWTFQRNEIESAAPKPGEDTALDQDRRRLMNLNRIEEGAGAAFEALYEAPESAAALVRTAAKRLDEVARLDPAAAGICEALEPAAIAIQEAAYGLRDYMAKLEADPARLEELEGRLAALDKLKRKYGSTMDEVIGFLEQTREQIAAAENSGERIAALRREQAELASQFEAAAARMTAQRKKAARELERQVVAELASLAMERSAFRIEVSPAPWSETGADAVRFLVSANPGEEPRPLEKVGSGGELSRIALALKTCLAASGAGRTLVFDEVDAGVGGRAAEGIGRRLKRLAIGDQVLCVTHLAQIAGFADHHYLVEKRESRGRTVATVEELDRAGRVREIGRMLSGEKLTAEALKHAERLIETGLAAKL
jgi:DNA repair protein RecN (Recombination protein N)